MKWILKHWWLYFGFSVIGGILMKIETKDALLVVMGDVFDLLAAVWLILIILALVSRGLKRLVRS